MLFGKSGKTYEQLVDSLDAYPRIQNVIEHNWATEYLDVYLIDLITDTRGDTRAGFPFETLEILVELQVMNLELIKELGAGDDNLNSRLMLSPLWELPKNF